MKVVNIQEAKTHLSRYVDEAAAGEEIVVAKAGKPLAKLVPYQPAVLKRQLGCLVGKASEARDAWSEETDRLIAAEFSGVHTANPSASEYSSSGPEELRVSESDS